jgi:hypothetical protein
MRALRTIGITLLLNSVAWGAANTTGTLYHMILGYGQSLSIGQWGGAPISTSQPYSNVMLNSGNTAFTPLIETTPFNGGYFWNSSTIYNYPAVTIVYQAWQAVIASTNIMPPSAGVWASVVTQESPTSSAVNNMTYLDPAHAVAGLANNYGVSGFPIANLQRGTGPYSALIAGVTAAQNITTAAGDSLVVEGAIFTEGEADCAVNSATYEADNVRLQSNLTTDIQAITGQTTPVRFFYSQTSSVEATSCSLHNCPDGAVACVDDPTGASTPGVVMSQFKLQADHPGLFYLTGPKYQFGYGDGVQHLDRDGYNMLGAETARILESVITGGNTSAKAGVYPASVTRLGNVITATFTSPGGLGLALDTSSLPPPFRNGVSDTVGMGFQFFQTGSSLTDNACGGGSCYNGGITNVGCTGLTCTITLSGTPAGASQRLAYAFEGTAGANSPQQGCASTATSCNGLATVSPSRGALHGNLRTVADYTNLNGATVYHWTPTFNVPVRDRASNSVRQGPGRGSLSGKGGRSN